MNLCVFRCRPSPEPSLIEMADDVQELLGDPVFQLNAALWMLIPARPESGTRPLLREVGYALDAIERNLHIPFELREQVANYAGTSGPTSPDSVACAAHAPPWLALECKRSSFGPSSSTAEQARKLIVLAADLRRPLGLSNESDGSGVVGYLTRAGESTGLNSTLDQLRAEALAAGLPTGLTGVLSLDSQNGQVMVRLVGGEEWPEHVRTFFTQPKCLFMPPEGADPRPLYLIPCDPNSVSDPESEHHKYGVGVFLDRVTQSAIASVGAAQCPQFVALLADALLESATYGVSNMWWGDGRNQLRRMAVGHLRRLLEPHAEEIRLHWQGAERVEFHLHTDATQNAVIERLVSALQAGADPDRLALYGEGG
jgi:hypothetical protein